MANDEYEVGYAKPPERNRFGKGISGNPKGRPKGKKNLQTIFQTLMNEKIRVMEGGKPKMMTRKEAIIRQLMNKAAAGDLKTMLEVMKWNQNFEAPSDAVSEASQDSARDKALVDSFMKELENMKLDTTPDEPKPNQPEEANRRSARPLNVIPGPWEGNDE